MWENLLDSRQTLLYDDDRLYVIIVLRLTALTFAPYFLCNAKSEFFPHLRCLMGAAVWSTCVCVTYRYWVAGAADR